VGYSCLQLSSKGQELFSRSDLRILQMHQDHVTVIPPEFINLASSELSKVQILMHAHKKILSFQGHPEYNSEIIQMIVDYRVEKGIFTQEFKHHVLKQLILPTDSVTLIKSFILAFYSL
jgi:GMP synthase-like glutamine amidotransferase